MHFKTHIVNIILAAVTTAEIQTTRYKGTRMPVPNLYYACQRTVWQTRVFTGRRSNYAAMAEAAARGS